MAAHVHRVPGAELTDWYGRGRHGGDAPSIRFRPLEAGASDRPDLLSLLLRLSLERTHRALVKRGVRRSVAWHQAWAWLADALLLDPAEADFALGFLHDSDPRFLDLIPRRSP